MRIGSLFSGIGGLELGLERAGVGYTVWQCEADAFCRSVLACHWPRVPRYEDVRTLQGSDLEPVDLLCGGFPCQDISSAGSRKGLAGERSGLWYQFARLVGELRPEWVVVENVISGACKWVQPVCAGLEQLGFQALPLPLYASWVGAPHERGRVFIIARRRDPADADASAVRDAEQRRPDGRAGWLRDARHDEHLHARAAGPAADADARRCESLGLAEHAGIEGAPGSLPLRRVEDRGQYGSPWGGGWPDFPAMVRVVHGVPAGLDRARVAALGNSVVPACAEVIGHAILDLLEGPCSRAASYPAK